MTHSMDVPHKELCAAECKLSRSCVSFHSYTPMVCPTIWK